MQIALERVSHLARARAETDVPKFIVANCLGKRAGAAIDRARQHRRVCSKIRATPH